MNHDYLYIDVTGLSEYSPFTLSDKIGGLTVVGLNEVAVRSSNGILVVLITILINLLGGGGLLIMKKM